MLTPRFARVVNGKIPTEQHGDERHALVDLKLETLVELAEINSMLGGVQGVTENPSRHIFDADNDNRLLLPDVDLVAKLRDKIKGEMGLVVGNDKLEAVATTVGAANALRFIQGGKGELTLQLRFEPTLHDMPLVFQALRDGEGMLSFLETEDSAKAADNTDQEEMLV